MVIREEKETEYGVIRDLVEESFLEAKDTEGDEGEFVEALRDSGNYIPSLALVAEENDRLIGHILFTRIPIETPGEEPIFIGLLLAPLCVAPAFRGRGIGAALIRAGEERARSLGYTAVFLAGDPDYYGRHGYVPASHFDILCDGDIPEPYVLAKELVPGALIRVTGLVPM